MMSACSASLSRRNKAEKSKGQRSKYHNSNVRLASLIYTHPIDEACMANAKAEENQCATMFREKVGVDCGEKGITENADYGRNYLDNYIPSRAGCANICSAGNDDTAEGSRDKT